MKISTKIRNYPSEEGCLLRHRAFFRKEYILFLKSIDRRYGTAPDVTSSSTTLRAVRYAMICSPSGTAQYFISSNIILRAVRYAMWVERKITVNTHRAVRYGIWIINERIENHMTYITARYNPFNHRFLPIGGPYGTATWLINSLITLRAVRDLARVERKFATPHTVPSGNANWRLKTASKI